MPSWIEKLLKKNKKKKAFFPERSTHFIQNIGGLPFRKRKRAFSFLKRDIFGSMWIFQSKFSLFIGLIVFVGILVIGALLGPFLRVQQIIISKKDIITNIEQAYSSVEYIRGKSIFLLDTQDLIERIRNGQSALQYIEIQINFPKTVGIELISYSPVFQTSQYFILSNGTVVEKETRDLGDIPILNVVSKNPEIFSFGNTLHDQDIQNMRLLEEKLLQNIPDFSIKNRYYFVSEKEFLLQDSSDTLFIFDLGGDIDQQVQQLVIFKKEKPELANQKYIYIDVRIPQKLFLCGFEEEFSCRKNIRDIYGAESFMNSETVSS